MKSSSNNVHIQPSTRPRSTAISSSPMNIETTLRPVRLLELPEALPEYIYSQLRSDGRPLSQWHDISDVDPGYYPAGAEDEDPTLIIEHNIEIKEEPTAKGDKQNKSIIKKLTLTIFSNPDNEDQGGFGTVQIALDAETGKSYALKKQEASDVSSAEIKRLQTVERLVGTIDCEVDGKQTNILVMDAVPGKNLWRSANDPQAAFSSHELFQLFSQAANEVEELHLQGILHRDIKDHNFVYDPLRKKLRIIDFGLAVEGIKDRKTGQLEYKTQQVAGTPEYNAPEIKQGAEIICYSPKTDIYSLGVMFANLCGMYNFKNNPHFKPLSSEQTQAGLAPIHAFIGRMLDPDPTKRPMPTEVAQFFNQQTVLFDHVDHHVKNIGIINIEEYLNASEKEKKEILQGLSAHPFQEIWLVSPKEFPPKKQLEIIKLRSQIEALGIAVGNQYVCDTKNGGLSAARLACYVPNLLQKDSQFLHRCVYISTTQLSSEDKAALNSSDITKWNPKQVVADPFKTFNDMPYPFQLNYKRMAEMIEHKKTLEKNKRLVKEDRKDEKHSKQEIEKTNAERALEDLTREQSIILNAEEKKELQTTYNNIKNALEKEASRLFKIDFKRQTVVQSTLAEWNKLKNPSIVVLARFLGRFLHELDEKSLSKGRYVGENSTVTLVKRSIDQLEALAIRFKKNHAPKPAIVAPSPSLASASAAPQPERPKKS